MPLSESAMFFQKHTLFGNFRKLSNSVNLENFSSFWKIPGIYSQVGIVKYACGGKTYAIVCKLVSRLINKEFLSIYKTSRPQGAPLTYFTDGGSGDFFGSEIFAKRDFLGLWKTRVFFLGGGGSREKTQELFWVLYFSSAQINNNISVIYWYCGIWRGGVC